MNAFRERMTPDACSSRAILRVVHPGRSNTKVGACGVTGNNKAHPSHPAAASSSRKTKLKNLFTIVTSLDYRIPGEAAWKLLRCSRDLAPVEKCLFIG